MQGAARDRPAVANLRGPGWIRTTTRGGNGSVDEEIRTWSLPTRWPDPLPVPALDTHGHLSDPAFAQDTTAVWDRAQQARVAFILDPGVDVASSVRACENARRFPGSVRAAAGVHPHEARVTGEDDWRDLERLASDPAVVAIGEVGLDAYREISPQHVQERALGRSLALAQKTGKPVLLHVRETYGRVLEILEVASPVRGILHAFWGDRATADAFLERGFVLGLGGALTFRREDALRETIRQLPHGSFVLETDMPYLAPHPVRGSRCESALIGYTARALAEVRGQPLAQLVAETTTAAATLFPTWPELRGQAH